MRKRRFTRLAARLLCGALLFTDAASLDVWAVSNDPNAEQIASLAEPSEEKDSRVTNDEGEAQKEAETSPEKEADVEQTESADAEEIDGEEADETAEKEAENPNQETDEPEGDDASVIEGEEEITLSAEEEQESVSENTVEEELNVNSLMAASEEDIASGTSNDISWIIDKNGKLTVSGAGDFERRDGKYTPWYDVRNLIETAEIDVTGMTDASYIFFGCSNLTSLNLSNFNTSSVTDMSNMFDGCENLESVDVSGFDTSRVTSMYFMFNNCSDLTSLDLSGFDVSQVTAMGYMFMGCSDLASLELGDFSSSNVTNINGMFSGCSSLTNLDLSGLNGYKLTQSNNMLYGMFYNCSRLMKINTPYNLRYTIPLPIEIGEIWTQPDGTEILDLPIRTSKSIEIVRNKKNLVAGENIASGKYEGITWTLNDAGKLTVEGTGDFSDDSSNYNRAPWSNYRTFIKSAKIDVTGMTNAAYMFYGCVNLASMDLSGFDTSKITSMMAMFFECSSLENLDVSSFNTGNVKSMWRMFDGCSSLRSLDLSNFDTRQVQNMYWIFNGCSSLTSLDLRNFYTGNITTMHCMFTGCSSLTNLDLSSFDTSKVTIMSAMFYDCNSLTSLKLSSFDTSKVTSMWSMFSGCENLTSLDLSSFNTGSVTDMNRMLSGCEKLTTIHTPRNVKQSVELPSKTGDKWYHSDGTVITELPQNLSYSIVITKNKKSEVSTPYITAVKEKTTYVCDETINTDDITVTYFNEQGDVIKLSTGFTTNVDEVNQTMSTPGKKTLIVTYIDSNALPSRELTAAIELTVTLSLTEANTVITLPDIQTGNNPIYNSRQHTPRVQVRLTQGDTVLDAGTDYTVSYKDNINAGTAAVVIKGIGVYSGTVEKTFNIDKAKVKIRVKDTTIAVDDAVPETFACEMTGFFNGDEDKVTGLSFSFAKEDGSSVSKGDVDNGKTGTYTVTPTAVTIGDNYVIDDVNGYQPGTLTIAEERVVYTVTFDMMGHGTETTTEPIKSVRSGRLIKEPTAPTAEGYLFTGWYKDQACTKAWNFAVDTVQTDTTLYARWVAQTAAGGIQIQEIPEQFYTGNTIKPVLAVYASDGTLLKAGKDYTFKYVNNINADQVTAVGGAYNSLDGSTQAAQESGFNAKLPYVEIKGKGNHTGTLYANFHIRQASVSDAGGNAAAGFTLKYTDQLVTNAKNIQKPFSSLKYKKAMTAGKDYTVTYSSDNVLDADGNAVKAEDGGKWTVTGTYEQSKNNKYTLPAIPKGYSGVFEMTVEGIGNYEGEIKREIYVTDKANLIKNVTVTLGKNQKNMPYNEGRAVILTPGYSDGKKYYKVSADGTISSTPEANANDLFTVKSGKIFLVWGQDYTVTYTNNRAVGTATMTITGIGNYKGSKSAAFKITGAAFKANTIEVKAYDQNSPNEDDFKASMPYTGSAVTQNKVTLTTKLTKTNPEEKTLRYGEHYTISYKNNIKKGTATMTFTAKPESGYSGSFNKTFKIGAVSLADPAFVKVETAEAAGQALDSLTSVKDDKGNTFYMLNGTVTYTREGAKPSQRIHLTLCDGKGNPTDVVLKEGTDYTVSYANNTVLKSANLANKIPTMTFKGKGNYAGNLKVTFDISEAAMEAGADNLTVSAAATAYDSKKASAYQYAPKVNVKDGKKALGKKDYTVQYEKCTQTDVEAYLSALEDSNATWETVQTKRPYAVIKALAGSGYTTEAGKEIKVYLDFYRTKLTSSNLYIIVSEGENLNIYSGQQVMPTQVTVYYSADTKGVAVAKKAKETDDDKLTSSSGAYKLTRLTPQTEVNGAGDYTLTYGVNVTAGKNKGRVTVTGTGMYGGSVTMKFTILQRDVYTAP